MKLSCAWRSGGIKDMRAVRRRKGGEGAATQTHTGPVIKHTQEYTSARQQNKKNKEGGWER